MAATEATLAMAVLSSPLTDNPSSSVSKMDVASVKVLISEVHVTSVVFVASVTKPNLEVDVTSVVFVVYVTNPNFAALEVFATAEALERFALKALALIFVVFVVSAPAKTSAVSVVFVLSKVSVVRLRLELTETSVDSVASALRLNSETSVSLLEDVALEMSDLSEVSPAFVIKLDSDQDRISVRCAPLDQSQASVVRFLLEVAEISVASVK